MNKLGDLTVVILAKDRNEHLKPTIEYYNKLDIKLIVIHESIQPIDVDSSSNNITYVISNKNYAERCLVAQKLIKTSYVILSTDDGRYLPHALLNMVETLNQNRKISSVGGQALGIYLFGPILCAAVSCQYNKNYSNLSENLSLRISNHFKKAGRNVTHTSIYRMYRSDDFKRMLNLFYLNKEISTPYIMEVTSEIFSLSIGGIEYLNDLLWVRNWVVQPINNSAWNRSLNFTEWWHDSTYELEKKQWEINLTSELGLNDFNLILSQLLLNRKFEIQVSQVSQEKQGFKSLIQNYKFFIKKIINNNLMQKNYKSQLSKLNQANIYYNVRELKVAIDSVLLPIGISTKERIKKRLKYKLFV